MCFFCRKVKQSVLSYVSDYYMTETLRETYAEEIIPTPHPVEWKVPDEVSQKRVGTPLNPKQAGRPRVNRIRARTHSSASSRTRICTRCRQPGHYKATCRQSIQTLQIMEGSTNEPSSSTRSLRRPKHCGLCGEVGHTRLTCKHRIMEGLDD